MQVLTEELLKHLNHINMVVNRTGFSHGVHSQERIAHVHALNINLTSENIAQSRATSHIAVVHEILAW